MPQFVSEPLSGARLAVMIEAESADPIGYFKGRGAWLAVEALAAARERGRNPVG